MTRVVVLVILGLLVFNLLVVLVLHWVARRKDREQGRQVAQEVLEQWREQWWDVWEHKGEREEKE